MLNAESAITGTCEILVFSFHNFSSFPYIINPPENLSFHTMRSHLCYLGLIYQNIAIIYHLTVSRNSSKFVKNPSTLVSLALSQNVIWFSVYSLYIFFTVSTTLIQKIIFTALYFFSYLFQTLASCFPLTNPLLLKSI